MNGDAKDPVSRYLDGDLSREALAPGERDEAEAWDRLLEGVRAQMPAASAPRWLEQRVMAEIGRAPAPSPLRRLWTWLTRPLPLRVSPLAAGLAAAAVAALALVGEGLLPARGGDPASASGTATATVFVQFVLEAPGARSVAVGGDFDGWQGSHTLDDPDGDGVWTGRVPLRPGVHAYMFLVDGAEWVTDPHAQRWSDDGFGNRNALLALTDPSV
ncbi:MAG: glycogen-binding domain-containing protein [Longimicrobiales bacterium]|nr:glycogen-binding domain-containing protein [Longimicrobiales bacterium]